MNRRGFFSLLGGSAVAGAIAKIVPKSEFVEELTKPKLADKDKQYTFQLENVRGKGPKVKVKTAFPENYKRTKVALDRNYFSE